MTHFQIARANKCTQEKTVQCWDSLSSIDELCTLYVRVLLSCPESRCGICFSKRDLYQTGVFPLSCLCALMPFQKMSTCQRPGVLVALEGTVALIAEDIDMAIRDISQSPFFHSLPYCKLQSGFVLVFLWIWARSFLTDAILLHRCIFLNTVESYWFKHA